MGVFDFTARGIAIAESAGVFDFNQGERSRSYLPGQAQCRTQTQDGIAVVILETISHALNLFQITSSEFISNRKQILRQRVIIR